ncbi:MAG: phosphoribosylglycinamide formyltransferase [Oscillospiraceae bacterium]|nr:phosphoribosylglycinamide formyltransferase [Oscillospiraceae bacterium]
MLRARIAVLVSGGGTNLQALLDAQAAGTLKSGEIALVVSNKPDVYALERAANAGVESAVITENFEENLENLLTEKRIDIIILAGFLRILSHAFTAKYPRRIINIHPSLIPAFCGEGYYGLRVHEQTLQRGVKLTGATVHFVNEIPDGGEIIAQKAVEVLKGDTPEILQKRVMEQAEWLLLPQAAELVSKEMIGG